jgi:hypothetical protein
MFRTAVGLTNRNGRVRSMFRMFSLIALVLAAAPAAAQNPSPLSTNPAAPVAPPHGRLPPPERIAPSNENPTDRLSQQKGTITPPNVDPGMQVNPPQNSRAAMPVIPPPGSSGESRSVVPK